MPSNVFRVSHNIVLGKHNLLTSSSNLKTIAPSLPTPSMDSVPQAGAGFKQMKQIKQMKPNYGMSQSVKPTNKKMEKFISFNF